VRCRLVSDVPLGAFLSGGVDSATVVGIMSQIAPEPVKTFSIGFEEQSHDELHYARIAARAFATDHHEEILRPNAIELLDKLVHHFDEPFGDPSALPTFMVSQMARRHVTVVLSGDGGDEAFAGYESHAVHRRDESFHRRVPAPLRAAVGAGLGAGARLTGHRKLTRVAGAVERANRPLAERFYKSYDKRLRRRLFAPDVRSRLAAAREEDAFRSLLGMQRFPDFLSGVLYADTKSYMTHDILVKVDRASMACSLEVRAPLVDHRLLEFVATIPSNLKLHGDTTKYIFKKTVESFVPREIVYREKHGFGVPIEAWFRRELRDLLREELLERRDEAAEFFDRGFVETMLHQHTSGARDWSIQLWPLLVFRLWWRRWKP
jgi:asparagine synthase (glutamine-hydrolysing)